MCTTAVFYPYFFVVQSTGLTQLSLIRKMINKTSLKLWLKYDVQVSQN